METIYESRFKRTGSGSVPRRRKPIHEYERLPSRQHRTTYHLQNLNGNTRATYWGTNNAGYNGRLISEISKTNVGSISKWKALATVATTGSRQSIKSNFSTSFTNITIDNKAITPVIDTQDFAKVTVSGNSVSLSVVKN